MTTLIQPNELRTPKLPPVQAASLLLALNTVLCENGRVTVSFTYSKQTDTPPSIGGVDHVEMPGVAPNAMIGDITSVERAQEDGHVYFRLNCLTRGDGTTPARPRSFRPEGVLLFAITGFVPNAEKLAQAATE